jgi:hypothetical protein
VGRHPFPRGITHADQDSETEINGRFLCVEGKRTGERLERGQKYTMEARVRDGRTCLIVYGNPETLTITHLQHYPGPVVAADWQMFYEFERAWAAWAEQQPKPEDRTSAFRAPWAPGEPRREAA